MYIWRTRLTNYTLRKVTPDGIVTTLAGLAGSKGSTDGPGCAARFNYPTSVAVDSSYNLYVADCGNHTIRKVMLGGVVTTLAGLAGNAGSTDGTGSAARFSYPQCVALDSAANLYVTDTGNHTIRKVTPGGGSDDAGGQGGKLWQRERHGQRSTVQQSIQRSGGRFGQSVCSGFI